MVNLKSFYMLFQSERLDLYQHHAEELISSGHAYHCFCSKERLKTLTYGYDKLCRSLSMRNVQEKLQGGEPYVIRLKVFILFEVQVILL